MSLPFFGESRLLQQSSIDRNGNTGSQVAERHAELFSKNSEVRFWHIAWKVSPASLFSSFIWSVFMIMYFLATSSDSLLVLLKGVSLPKLLTFSSWSKQILTSLRSSDSILLPKFPWICQSSAMELKTVAEDSIKWIKHYQNWCSLPLIELLERISESTWKHWLLFPPRGLLPSVISREMRDRGTQLQTISWVSL